MTSVASSRLPEGLATVIVFGKRLRTRSIRPVPAAISKTGVRVRKRDPARAKTTVHAIGLNIFPSRPPRERIGRSA